MTDGLVENAPAINDSIVSLEQRITQYYHATMSSDAVDPSRMHERNQRNHQC